MIWLMQLTLPNQVLLVSVQNDNGREHAANATAASSKDSLILWYRGCAVRLTVIGYVMGSVMGS